MFDDHYDEKAKRRPGRVTWAQLAIVTLAGIFVLVSLIQSAQNDENQQMTAVARTVVAEFAGITETAEQQVYAQTQTALVPTVTSTPTQTATVTSTATSTPTLTPTVDQSLFDLKPRGTPEGGIIASVIDFVWRPDGQSLMINSSWDGFVGYRVEDFFPLQRIAEPDSSRRMALSQDGSILAYGGQDIILMDTRTGNQLATLSGHNDLLTGLLFNHDGTTLISAGLDGKIQLWDINSRQRIADVMATGFNDRSIASIALNRDGSQLATLSTGGEIRLWRVSANGEVNIITTLEGVPVRPGILVREGLVFSPDGKLLAAVSGSDVRLWAVDTHEQIGTLEGHREAINSLSFSADGSILASGSTDGTIRLWYVPYWTELKVLLGHEDAVSSVAFSPVGLTLVSRDVRDILRLWGLGFESSNAIPVPTPATTD
jgi:WD40 repeat protein